MLRRREACPEVLEGCRLEAHRLFDELLALPRAGDGTGEGLACVYDVGLAPGCTAGAVTGGDVAGSGFRFFGAGRTKRPNSAV